VLGTSPFSVEGRRACTFSVLGDRAANLNELKRQGMAPLFVKKGRMWCNEVVGVVACLRIG